MSLINKVSLCLTPNAVKEGKIYSIIPSYGNGDMAFTRATTATRVNSEGFIEDAPYNLLSYSEDFSNFWGNTATTVTINQGIAPNGTNTMDLLSFTTSTSSIYQSIAVNSGSTYTFSVWLRTQSGTETIKIGNINAGIYTNVTVTTTLTRFEVTQVASASSRLPAIGATSICNILAWGAQVVQGSVPQDYFYTTNRLNVPRLNYDVAGGCPSILLEPQRTNLALRSQEFENAVWGRSAIGVIANSTTSPSNINNADTITADGLNFPHSVYQVISTTAGNSYTFSCYVKANTGRYVIIQITTNGTVVRYSVVLDLQTGVITQVNTSSIAPTGISNTVTNFINGYYKVSLTLTSVGTSSALIIATSDSGTPTFNASLDYVYVGTQSYYVWGAQLEVGAYSTSYIPTTTSAVTRNTDVLSRNNIYTNGLITSAGGTWFIELNNNFNYIRDVVSYAIILDTNTGGFANGFYLRQSNPTLSRIYIGKTIGGVRQDLYLTLTDVIKVAINWNGTVANVFVNGIKVTADTIFTPTTMEFLNSQATDVPKYIKSMMLFPTPLSDTEMIQLTTL